MKQKSLIKSLLVICVLMGFPWFASEVKAVAAPELPRVYVDTSMPVQSGATFNVANNCAGLSNCSTNLQTTINSAQPGDTIVLKAGDTFAGTFNLPNKSNPQSKWIIIQSSKLSSLPPMGTRVSLADAANMPTVTGGGSQPQIAIQAKQQSNYFRFIGIRFIPNPSIFSTGLIRLGEGNETSVSQLPHHIVFDRVIVSGDPNLGGRRGIALNSRMTGVVDSYLNDWKDISDAQAMGGWNGAEGYKIVNNYLEASGENIMWGGAANTIPNVNPSDMEIRNNYFYKPIAWKGDSRWAVKNLFELKVGERVLLEGNVMDGSWSGAQGGKAINLKSTNQNGSGPSYYHTGDVIIRNNIIRNVGMVMTLVGIYPGPATVMNNIEFTNNIVENVNVAPYSGDGNLFVFGTSNPVMNNINISHNTIVSTGSLLSLAQGDSNSADNVAMDNNILMNGQYGFKVGGVASGNTSLTAMFSNGTFKNNAIVGGAGFGTNSYFPATLAAINFTDLANSNYQILSGALKNGASDGLDVGANVSLVTSLTTGVISGTPGVYTPPVTPPPVVIPPVVPPVVVPPTTGVLLPAGTTAGDIVSFGAPPYYLVAVDGLHPFDTTTSLNTYIASSGRLIKPVTVPISNFTVSTVTAAVYLNQTTTPPVVVVPPTTTPAPTTIVGTNVVYNGTVYFYDGNNLRPYTSEGAFLSYGFNSFATVIPSTGAYALIPLAAYAAPRDGSLINDKGTVYLITDGKRAGFTSSNIFTGLGFSFSNVLVGDTSFMTTLPPIDTISRAHPPGTLVIDQGTVYLVGTKGKIGIPTMAVFTSWGFNLKDVVKANSEDISASLPLTNVLVTRPAGALNALAFIGG